MPRENPEHELLEPKEERTIIPRDVQFELVFRKEDDGNSDKMNFEPAGEFRYFSGENRPIAPKYKLYLPEKYKDKEKLKIVFEEMGKYLLSIFSGWSEPETEEDFSTVLFGGYDRKTKMINFDSFFPLLRYTLEKKGISMSVDEWENILKDMDGLDIDVGDLFPQDDLPLDYENYKNFWQYEIFGASPPTPPHSSHEKFFPPLLKIKITDELLETARKNRKIVDDITSNENPRSKPTDEKKSAQLEERYQCIYGVDPAGRTINSMAYYPEINGTKPDLIEIVPRKISYEITASAAPEVPASGWNVIFPQDTPKNVATVFMRVLQTWDGLRVLDDLTVTEAGRTELAFNEAEKKVLPDDYKQFKEWVKGKRARFIRPEVEAEDASHDKNLS